MTVSASTSRADYTGNGVTTAFAVPFYFLDQTHLDVQRKTLSTGAVQTLALTTDYTVTGAGVAAGGTVTLTVAPTIDQQISVVRDVPRSQLTHYVPNDPFPAAGHETALDKLTMLAQEIDEKATRAIRFSSTDNADGEMPALSLLKGRLLAFDATTGLPEPSTFTLTQVASMVAAVYAAAAGPLDALTFLQAGTGAVPRTAQDKARDWLNAKDFGVKADGVTDDINALDLATAAAITLKKKLKLPAGTISISRPWVIANRTGTVYSQVSIDIEGEKDAWTTNNLGISNTRIVPTFNDTFAVGIQLARGSKLKDFTVVGKNTISISGSAAMVNANYVTAGCRDSRYSPYAGVVIDPFGASVPPDGGYPGMSAYYAASAGGSGSTVLENVVSTNFVVSFLLGPATSANTTSEIDFRSCIASNSKIGLAMCQAQSRNVRWYGGSVTTNLIGFDGVTYGLQTGYAPGIFGCNMSGKYLFNVKIDVGNSAPMCGIHAEAFASLGFFGSVSGSSRQPVEFVGCEFKFIDFGGVFPDHHLVAGTNVNFFGGHVDVQGFGVKSPIRVFKDSASQMNFYGMAFSNHQLQEFWMAFSGLALHPSQGVNFQGCTVSDTGGRGPNVFEMGGKLSYSDISNPSLSVQPLGTTARFNNSAAGDVYAVGNNDALSRVSLGPLVVTLGATGFASFTVADGTTVRTGDMIYSSTAVLGEAQDLTTTFSDNWMCLGLVSDVTGNVVTITGVPQNLASGTYTLFATWWPRWHGPTTGDTSTSITILNVSQPGLWKIGNKIQGAGIVPGTYIQNIVGSTFTLSKPTTATAVGVRLFDADIYKFSGTAV